MRSLQSKVGPSVKALMSIVRPILSYEDLASSTRVVVKMLASWQKQ
jgi:hypothetical protein